MAVAFPATHFHVGVVTRDLDEGMAAAFELFGLQWVPSIPPADQIDLVTAAGPVEWRSPRTALSTGGPMHIELLEGGVGSVWHTSERAVLHHIAYWVDDLLGTIDMLGANGWTRELTRFDDEGLPCTFAYMTKPGTARVELADASRRDEIMARAGWSEVA